MNNRTFKITAVLVIVSFLSSQNLYAFTAFTPIQSYLPSVIVQNQNPPNSKNTNIIGLSLAAIQGQIITNPGTTLEVAFSNIRPNLLSSLAQYGMDRLGVELGIDSRITSLVSLPLSSALNARLVGESAVDAIMNGILRGGVTLGIEAATKDLSPIMGALTARAVSGAIAGLISQDHNAFRGILDAYTDSFVSLATLGGSGSAPRQSE